MSDQVCTAVDMVRGTLLLPTKVYVLCICPGLGHFDPHADHFQASRHKAAASGGMQATVR